MPEEKKDKASDELKALLDKAELRAVEADTKLKESKAKRTELETRRLERIEKEKAELEKVEEARSKLETDVRKRNKDIKHPHVKITNTTVQQAEDLVRMVGNGSLLGATLIGPAGMGKTHTVEYVLDEMKCDYTTFAGHITLPEVYKFLFENHNKLCFFDDCSSLIKNVEIMELLKRAMNLSVKTRILDYRSRGVLGPETPRSFAFDGKIIMCFNTMDRNDPNVKAILDRAMMVEMKYQHEEIINAMKAIATTAGVCDELREDEKLIVVDEIESWSDASMDVSIRKLFQSFKVYADFKKIHGEGNLHWIPMVRTMFGKKRDVWMRELVRELAGEKAIKRSELVKELVKRRGMSPRTADRKITEFLDIEAIYADKGKFSSISINPF